MNLDFYPYSDSYSDYLKAVVKKEEVMKILDDLTYGQAVRTLYLCSYAMKERAPKYRDPIVECLKDENDHVIGEIMQSEKIEEPDKLLDQIRESEKSVREEVEELQKDLEKTRRESRQSFWVSLLALVIAIIWAIIRILT